MRLRAIVAIAAAALAAMLLAPAAQAAQPRPAAQAPGCYPGGKGVSVAVSTTRPLVGEQITVSGAHFKAGATVRLVLHSPGTVLKTVTTNDRGMFTTTVTLPDGVTGRHRLVAVGPANRPDCPGDSSATLNIQSHGVAGTSAGPGGPGGTSFTGVDVLLIVIAAVLLLGIGYLLNKTGGKRKQGSGHPLIDN